MRYGEEYFGTEPQQLVSKRARNIWQLVPDDPLFSYNGRVVTLVGNEDPKMSEKLVALARLQGATACHFLPKEQGEIIKENVDSTELSTNVWELCKGERSAYEAAQNILVKYQLPTDITVERLSSETAPARLVEFAAMAEECGVLVMSGRVMRGLDIPGITLAGIDQSGQVIGSAWGYKCYHPKSAFYDYAFWGGLSCRKDRRGQRIALILGALAIVQLWEDIGVRGFCTGVVEGNTASYSVCKKLGVLPSDEIFLGVTDPVVFKGASLTK